LNQIKAYMRRTWKLVAQRNVQLNQESQSKTRLHVWPTMTYFDQQNFTNKCQLLCFQVPVSNHCKNISFLLTSIPQRRYLCYNLYVKTTDAL